MSLFLRTTVARIDCRLGRKLICLTFQNVLRTTNFSPATESACGTLAPQRIKLAAIILSNIPTAQSDNVGMMVAFSNARESRPLMKMLFISSPQKRPRLLTATPKRRKRRFKYKSRNDLRRRLAPHNSLSYNNLHLRNYFKNLKDFTCVVLEIWYSLRYKNKNKNENLDTLFLSRCGQPQRKESRRRCLDCGNSR